jgi:threonine dehydratase
MASNRGVAYEDSRQENWNEQTGLRKPGREHEDWVRMIGEAQRRISGLAVKTPVTLLGDEPGRFGSARVYLKLENLQKTGSFKLRGASNRVLSLTENEAGKGVVTSSSGNHGLGVAASAHYRGIDAEVFLSAQVSPDKHRWMRERGARVRQVGQNPLDAESAARAAAAESGRTYISPYNDQLVIAGQGTIALELVQQVPSIDAVYVAVGGGGLISGIGSYLKAVSPETDVVGCWPRSSRAMYESLKAGHIIEFDEKPTLSESTAGGVEPGSITFPLCQRVVDRHVLVSELEILNAMRWAMGRGWMLEGAAGVAIAAFCSECQRYAGKTVVIVCCGGNLSQEVVGQL